VGLAEGVDALSVGLVSSVRSGFSLGFADSFLSPCSVGLVSSDRSIEPRLAPSDGVASPPWEALGPAVGFDSSPPFMKATVTPVAASTTVTAAAASRTRPLRRRGPAGTAG
jgi:hypothetical protein